MFSSSGMGANNALAFDLLGELIGTMKSGFAGRTEKRASGAALRAAITSVSISLALTGCIEANSPQQAAQEHDKSEQAASTTSQTSEPPAPASSMSNMSKHEQPTQYSIDMIKGRNWSKKDKEIDAGRNEKVIMLGWAVDSATKDLVSGVDLCIDNTDIIPGQYGMSRPDLVQGYKIPSWGKAGYSITVDCSKLNPGRHNVSLRIVSADKSYYYEPVKLVLNVKDQS